MNRNTLQIPFLLEKKIYKYSSTLMSRYQMCLNYAIRSNNPTAVNLFRELITHLRLVLECEKAGCHLDLLPWRVDRDK